MKTSQETDLRTVPDLKGRWLEVYHEGFRMARLLAFRGPRRIAVRFQAREGRHVIDSSCVRGVYWRRRVVTLQEWRRIRESPKVQKSDNR